MRNRYETPAEQLHRLKQDAAKFAKGHAGLVAAGSDFHKIKTSRNVFRAKVYNERLTPDRFEEITDLFDDLVSRELDAILDQLHAA